MNQKRGGLLLPTLAALARTINARLSPLSTWKSLMTPMSSTSPRAGAVPILCGIGVCDDGFFLKKEQSPRGGGGVQDRFDGRFLLRLDFGFFSDSLNEK